MVNTRAEASTGTSMGRARNKAIAGSTKIGRSMEIRTSTKTAISKRRTNG